MIRVAIRMGMLGEQVQHLPAMPAELLGTPRELLDAFDDRLPHVPMAIAVDGELLDDEDLDKPFRDRCQVILVPETGYSVLAFIGYYAVQILISLAVSAAISYVAYLLSPRPKAPGVPQERGDDASPSAAWDGPKTSYGPGLPVPWGYGRFALPGQVIWMDAEASRDVAAQASLDDRLRMILSLCEGPVARIGGVTGHTDGVGGLPGEPSGGPFLDGVRINGNLIPRTSNPGVRAWTRAGTQDQPEMPPPLAGISRAFSPLVGLNEFGDEHVFTFAEDVDVSQISVVLYAPSGLYQVNQQGGQSAYGVGFIAAVFVEGVQVWTSVQSIPPTNTPVIGPYAQTWDVLTLGPGSGGSWNMRGPFELRVRRLVTSGAPNAISAVQLRDIVVKTPTTLSYPLDALLGLEIQAGAQFSGGRPNITVECDLSFVRVWTPEDGWSPPCWDVPAAPWNFHAYAPGRNPAWCLLHFLLARWGLGKWITEDRIDLPSFMRWAVFCDQDPNPADPWGEPQFTVDLVGDRARPAWEWVIAFCSAGRATPTVINGKIGVVYQYRDAHSQGTTSVPAKTPVQVITGAMIEDLQVNWLAKADRPTMYQFQFLNEEKAYAQDVVPVEDDESTHNDPTAANQQQYRPEPVQAIGITRASQLWREGRWRHAINREVDHEVTFTAGPHAIALQVGDVFELQHDVLRPFGDDVPIAAQVRAGGAATTQAAIDHHLTGTGLEIVWRKKDQTVGRADIEDPYVNTTDAQGRPLCVIDFGAAQEIEIGSFCTIGVKDKVTVEYEVARITLREDLKRDIRAVKWTPSAYDPPLLSDYLEGAADLDDPEPEDLALDPPDNVGLPASVLGIAVTKTEEPGHRVRWSMPSNLAGTQARVYVRISDLPGAWVYLGSSEHGDLQTTRLAVNVEQVLSVCLRSRDGAIVPPELGDHVTVTPEEWPTSALPDVSNVRSTVIESGLLLQWDDLGQHTLEAYEIRAGSSWAVGEVLYRGRTPRVVLPEPRSGVPLLIAARARSGLFGPISTIAAVDWQPDGTAEFLDVDDLPPAGTLTNVVWNSTDGVLELADGLFEGTYESLAQDLTTQAPYFWQVRVDSQERENVTVGEIPDFSLGSGEARWRLVEGRPASPMQPGLDWQTRIEDIEGLVGDLPAGLLVGGDPGEFGSHTQVLVESRFHVDGSWTEYRRHVDRVVVARQMQVRLTFGRRTLDYDARCSLLTYRAFL